MRCWFPDGFPDRSCVDGAAHSVPALVAMSTECGATSEQAPRCRKPPHGRGHIFIVHWRRKSGRDWAPLAFACSPRTLRLLGGAVELDGAVVDGRHQLAQRCDRIVDESDIGDP